MCWLSVLYSQHTKLSSLIHCDCVKIALVEVKRMDLLAKRQGHVKTYLLCLRLSESLLDNFSPLTLLSVATRLLLTAVSTICVPLPHSLSVECPLTLFINDGGRDTKLFPSI